MLLTQPPLLFDLKKTHNKHGTLYNSDTPEKSELGPSFSQLPGLTFDRSIYKIKTYERNIESTRKIRSKE